MPTGKFVFNRLFVYGNFFQWVGSVLLAEIGEFFYVEFDFSPVLMSFRNLEVLRNRQVYYRIYACDALFKISFKNCFYCLITKIACYYNNVD